MNYIITGYVGSIVGPLLDLHKDTWVVIYSPSTYSWGNYEPSYSVLYIM